MKLCKYYLIFRLNNFYISSTRLCNFAGICGESKASFLVKNNSIPVAIISGMLERSTTRNNFVKLSVVTSDSMVNFSYIWKVFDSDSIENFQLSLLCQVPGEPTSIVFPPYSLQPNTKIKVALYTLDSQLPFSPVGQSIVFVYVKMGSLVARIKGGSQVALSPGTEITLDASHSYDSDLPESVNDRYSHLTVTWSCARKYVITSVEICDVDLTILNSLLVLRPKGASKIGSVYAITLTVSDSFRRDSTTVDIHLTAAMAPLISIQSASEDFAQTGLLQLFGTMNWSNVNSTGSTYQSAWSVSDDSGIDLSSIALTPLALTHTAETSTMNLAMSSRILRGLLWSRSSLTFTLSCTPSASSVSASSSVWASITLSVNSQPSPGHDNKCFH